jgi:hypothetical protein
MYIDFQTFAKEEEMWESSKCFEKHYTITRHYGDISLYSPAEYID